MRRDVSSCAWAGRRLSAGLALALVVPVAAFALEGEAALADLPAAEVGGSFLALGLVPLSILTIALVILGLLSLRIASRRAGGRDVPVPHERWTRIAQEARR